jgi:hypothetical protein
MGKGECCVRMCVSIYVCVCLYMCVCLCSEYISLRRLLFFIFFSTVAYTYTIFSVFSLRETQLGYSLEGLDLCFLRLS